MSDTLIVAVKIVSLFLVMMVGWVCRRRGYIDNAATSMLSRLTTDIALPALTFMQMLETVDRQSMAASWPVPLIGAGLILIGLLVGALAWRRFCPPTQGATFIFLVAIANWVYLPLPIVEAVYGASGVRQLFLANVGMQVVLWTVGMATLRGGRIQWKSTLTLLRNPGLVATLLGIAFGLLKGDSHVHPGSVFDLGLGANMALTTVFDAARVVGSVTIPLSLVLTGAQLGAIRLVGPRPVRAITGVLLLRMLVVPLIVLALIWLIHLSGWVAPPHALMVNLIVGAMPVAISCSLFTERFHQDTALAAETILYSTLISIGTVPLLFWVGRNLSL